MGVKFCGNCGSKMNEGQKFCGECGWSVKEVEEVDATIKEDSISNTANKASNNSNTKLINSVQAQIYNEDLSSEEIYSEKVNFQRENTPKISIDSKNKEKVNINRSQPNKVYKANKTNKKSNKGIAIFVIITLIVALVFAANKLLMSDDLVSSSETNVTKEEILGIYTGQVSTGELNNIDKAELTEEEITLLEDMQNDSIPCLIKLEEDALLFSITIDGEELPAPAMEYYLENGVLMASIEIDGGSYSIEGIFGEYNDKRTLEGKYILTYPVANDEMFSVEFNFNALEYEGMN